MVSFGGFGYCGSLLVSLCRLELVGIGLSLGEKLGQTNSYITPNWLVCALQKISWV